MSRFSDLLLQAIQGNKIRYSTLSEMTGIERTLIHRLANGSRIPSGKEMVLNLANVLQLNPDETDKILQAFYISKMGEEVWERRQLAKNFIRSFTRKPVSEYRSDGTITISESKHEAIPETGMVREENAVRQLLDFILLSASREENGNIFILAQPEFEILYDSLVRVDFSANHTKIEQIMCFQSPQNAKELESDRYNFNCLNAMIPVMISCTHYACYSYFDNVGSLFNFSSFLPYTILTDKYVLQVSASCDSAYFSEDPEYISYWKEIFLKKKQFSNPVFGRLLGLEGYLQSIVNAADEKCSCIYAVMGQPCIGDVLTPDIIGQFTYPHYLADEKIRSLLELMAVKKASVTGKSYWCYPEEGFGKFVESGRVSEIPSESYAPLEKDASIEMLRNVRKLLDLEKYNLFLSNSERFRIPSKLTICGLSPMSVYVSYNDEKSGFSVFNISEIGLSGIIYDFLEYTFKSDLVFSDEISKEKLDKFLSQY